MPDYLSPVISSLQYRISKGIPWQAEVALGVPGRLRPRIFSTFGSTRVKGRQPNAPAAFTLGEIPSTHFQKMSRPQGTWFCRKEPRKKSQVTPPEIDPGTVRLVAQSLNHFATPGPLQYLIVVANCEVISYVSSSVILLRSTSKYSPRLPAVTYSWSSFFFQADKITNTL